jgi:hypothetical protein
MKIYTLDEQALQLDDQLLELTQNQNPNWLDDLDFGSPSDLDRLTHLWADVLDLCDVSQEEITLP